MDRTDKHSQVGLLRIATGIALIAALVYFCITLLPPYAANYRFQQYLEQASSDPALAAKDPTIIQVEVLRKAQAMNIPARLDQVRVARADAGRTRIEVRYYVRVDLPFYTVDLHFRPRAGGR